MVEENHGFDRIYGVPEAPYINELARRGALFTASYALTHPSQPNYLALFSGSTQGVSDDSCPKSFNRPNLASALLDGGFTFSGYSESLPAIGSATCDAGAYARKHNPWVDFVNVPRSLNLPFTYFPSDFRQLPDLCFVIPNLNNDMHDGSVAQGDAWLREHLDAYVQWATTNNSLLVLTQDEGHDPGDNRLMTFFLGPMVQPGQYSGRISHFTLLRTLLAMYGLDPIGRSADTEPITNCWTPESLNPPLTASITAPSDGAFLEAPISVTLIVDVLARDSSVRKVEFFNARVKLGETTEGPFQFTLTNAPAGQYSFIAKATDNRDRVWISSAVHVRVSAPDTTPPSVTITTPRPDAQFSNAVVMIEGTASDDVGLSRVEYGIGDGAVQIASGTTNWSAKIELAPGTNAVWARSVNFHGNISMPATVKLIFVVTSALTIDVRGSGTVTPNLDGAVLPIGQLYTVTAKPAPGYLFAGWSGGVTSNATRLSFQMQSNLALRAVFILNPFVVAKGSYHGLFFETNEIMLGLSGSVTLNTTEQGVFSGELQSAGHHYAFRGQFDVNGQATSSVPRPGTNALMAVLSLNLAGTGDQIRGKIGDGTGTANLLADRAVFNAADAPAPYAGQYILDIPADANQPGAPPGDSFAALRVDKTGLVRLAGTLADGTKVTAAAPISKDGFWPLYVSLYGGAGSLLSWLTFAREPDDAPHDDVRGSVRWSRPAQPGRLVFPSGFTNRSEAIGSEYVPPGGLSRVMNFTNALVEFSGGDVTASFTNAVVLRDGNRFANLSSNGLTVAISLPTGIWRGTVTDPFTHGRLTFQGALLQDENVGVGFFAGSNQTGRVVLRSK